MMGLRSGLLLVLFLMGSSAAAGGLQAPNQPRLLTCRSPEKETFTCWWEPGDAGDLNTTYALYYSLEGSDKVYECPDYKTAGPNSCFFNKSDTSLWVNYNITVMATNSMGSSISEPIEVDVAHIVQPNTPERVKVEVMNDEEMNTPVLRVTWEKPQSADTRSGWITLIYQLRVKQIKGDSWEEYNAGMQKYYNVFSLLSGKEYMVQVRCKPDHGFWSEWTSPVYIQMPEFLNKEHSVWILVAVFSAVVLLIITWTMNLKRNSVKRCLLPPVPGPKIKGFDKQLLKNGKSEEVLNALVIHSFPPTKYEELLVDYLEVYDNDETHNLVLDSKDQHVASVNSMITSLDSDSGRGSCDSRTLLLDKSTQGRNLGGTKQVGWGSEEPGSLIREEGKARMWNNVFSAPQLHPEHHYYQQDLHLQQPHDTKCTYHNIPEISCISSSVHISRTVENHLEELLIKPRVCGCFQTDCMDGVVLQSAESQPTEYVEVQTVDQENVLHVQPLSDPEERRQELSDSSNGENYSKVRDVISDNLLLLQSDVSIVPQECQCQTLHQENHQTCKHSTILSLSSILQPGNGYVDSTMMTS
ncbi:prolactin receptor a [Tachysurus vachellii]|uniref:prolactin receptor a n=1 Tax=Tachysurus vachellii TaxID=175792 RepID=UPI00296B113A|nr:prolactin receptor a [Tachysurus vachellii]XP_060747065.1 prolactin receptor a [Tachysurus vachellii]XP_060747066.1 prolactin receptor a [Tachysurus vachellii]